MGRAKPLKRKQLIGGFMRSEKGRLVAVPQRLHVCVCDRQAEDNVMVFFLFGAVLTERTCFPTVSTCFPNDG